MAEPLKNGSDYRLSLRPLGESGAFVTLACETGTTVNVSVNMLETSCKGDVDEDGRNVRTFKPGKINFNLSTEINVKLGEGGLTIFDVTELLKSGAKQEFEFANGSGTLLTGAGLIESQGLVANDNATATGSITLNGTGALTVS